MRRHLPRFRRRQRFDGCRFHQVRVSVEAMEDRVLLATFTVMNTLDAGLGSLRQAIIDANTSSGNDTIEFAIPGPGPHTIFVQSALPELTDTVTIDGRTQPGFDPFDPRPRIEINGFFSGANFGLALTSDANEVHALSITSFAGVGIVALESNGNLIQGNHIGVDTSGTEARGNGLAGLAFGDSSDNTIANNLISGNFGIGLASLGLIVGSSVTSNNLILGNRIGTDFTGSFPLGNGNAGIGFAGASDNTIAGNVISANGFHGINFDGIEGRENARNLIVGNRIGTDISGTFSLGNAGAGIRFAGAGSNTIGGSNPGDGNVISANGFNPFETFAGIVFGPGPEGQTTFDNEIQGNFIGTDINGELPLGNAATGITFFGAVGNRILDNVISANFTFGIGLGTDFSGLAPTGNLIQGNRIGTDVTGRQPLGNGRFGIILDGSFDNTIGGAEPGQGNVISANGGSGIGFSDFAGLPTVNNRIQGNRIGTDIDGRLPLGNAQAGITFAGAIGNEILDNVISANGFFDEGFNGIDFRIGIGTGLAASGNRIRGNRIGTDVTGTQALGNAANGIGFFGATDNTIGGNLPGDFNVISANRLNGITFFATPEGAIAERNLIQGNRIGTDVTGTRIVDPGPDQTFGTADDTPLGNVFNGIVFNGAIGNTIGGLDPGAGNVVSGNGGVGIGFFDFDNLGFLNAGNLIQGNRIGTDVGGIQGLGNAQSGLSFFANAMDNTIGGSLPGAGNVISANGFSGTGFSGVVFGSQGEGLAPSRNQISGNQIGTDISGTAALGNAFDGISFFGSVENSIGGVIAGEGNVISANRVNGISIVAIPGSVPSRNVIQGNRIGTDTAGIIPLGNNAAGINFLGARENTIGGSAPGAGNLISDNGFNRLLDPETPFSGIVFSPGPAGELAEGNLLQGNLIGSNAAGNRRLGNALDGITFFGSQGNEILQNIILANGGNGISLVSTPDGRGSIANELRGNFIGTNPVGFTGLGNAFNGVAVFNGQNNTIGGSGLDDRNVISSNGANGIFISSFDLSGPLSTGNQIIGNRIGTDPTGQFSMGNSENGIILIGASNNSVGGLTATIGQGVGNLISANGNHGIFITAVRDQTGQVLRDEAGQILGPALNNQIQGNLIGANVFGNNFLSNRGSGVVLSESSSNLVGGESSEARNLISGNQGNGVVIEGPIASGNQVFGNFIGTDLTGVFALGNAFEGVSVFNAPENVIGASNDLATTSGNVSVFRGNVISGNFGGGIRVSGPLATRNRILGNRIGTNVSGNDLLGNLQAGVFINSSENTIGGANPGDRNLISGNRTGIAIFGNITFDSNSTQIVNFESNNGEGDSPVLPGPPIEDLFPALPRAVSVESVTGNLVLGNFVGTDITGTRSLPNFSTGIEVANASNNTIGGPNVIGSDGTLEQFRANLISGNFNNGVAILGSPLFDNSGNLLGNTATGNLVIGNLIGTDRNGMFPVFNVASGVLIQGANGNTVGGTSPQERNVISNNLGSGVELVGFPVIGVDGAILGHAGTENRVLGNFIGTDVTGQGLGGNRGSGVELFGARGNLIGGTEPGASNIISDNAGSGIVFLFSANNRVEGNFIGTDITGMRDLGNELNGVSITVASFANTIGGTTPEARNVISGNNANGVNIILGVNLEVFGNEVLGNFIGTNADGTGPLGNLANGVFISNSFNNQVGNNVISGNGLVGVNISGDQVNVPELGVFLPTAANGNQVFGNFIGTNADGTAAVANRNNGIIISNGQFNLIGGPGNDRRNIISGNDGLGIQIVGPGAIGNLVSGNFIGTDKDGQRPLRNLLSGVVLQDTNENRVHQNVITASGGAGVLFIGRGFNELFGNFIGTDQSGNALLESNGLPIGNAGDGVSLLQSSNNRIDANVIAGNGGVGLSILAGSSDNQILRNFIGIGLSGTNILSNERQGILLDESSFNVIGGIGEGDRNVISGNNGDGIALLGARSIGNLVLGNFIGTDAFVSAALGNNGNGLRIENARNTTVGNPAGNLDPVLAERVRNVISGNLGSGIEVVGNVEGTSIQGNFIGLDALGQNALGNEIGVFLNNVVNINVGGTDPGAGNVISGNRSMGIQIFSVQDVRDPVSNALQGNSIVGNFIGTDATGTNTPGVQPIGVFINNGPANRIGGAEPGARNVISGNSTAGILLSGSRAVENQILGNLIGPAVDRSPLNGQVVRPIFFPNGTVDLGVVQQRGIGIIDAPNNRIGDVGAGNTIAFNGAGVEIVGPQSSNNVVQSNLIALNLAGVFINNAPNNLIGGDASTTGNTIVGNISVGLEIVNQQAVGNRVQGNNISDNRGLIFIIDTADAAPRAEVAGVGVYLEATTRNLIGGDTANLGNTIDRNARVGVYMFNGANQNRVIRNRIVGNGEYGVFLFNSDRNVADVVRSGPEANVIRGSRIASFREFTGAVLPRAGTPQTPQPRPRGRQARPAQPVPPVPQGPLPLFNARTSNPSESLQAARPLG